MGGGMSNGQNNKNNGVDGMPPGGINNNTSDPCHNGTNMSGSMGSGSGSGGYNRLASDPLPPVHILGLGGHFGSSSGGGGGIGGSFLRGYDHRQTETLLDVCVGGGGGGGHLGSGNDPLLLPLPSPESLLELAELYRDDPPVGDVDVPPPEPPPLLAPLTPLEQNAASNSDHCRRGHDSDINLNSQYNMQRNNNSMVENSKFPFLFPSVSSSNPVLLRH